MKLPVFNKLFVFAIGATLAATWCKKTPVGVTMLPDYPGRTGSTNDLASGTTTTTDDDVKSKLASGDLPLPGHDVHDNWLRDVHIFEGERVHFDYDSSVIKAPEKPKVATLA